jgi:excisionase family DNA binding protein
VPSRRSRAGAPIPATRSWNRHAPGDDVEVYEPETGLVGHGRVTDVDATRRLVYLAVDWTGLHELEPAPERPRPRVVPGRTGTDASPTLERSSGTSGTRRPRPLADDDPLLETRFFTIGEIARIARVSKMTVYREVHAGRLESVRIGRSFRIPEESVRRWLGDQLGHAVRV